MYTFGPLIAKNSRNGRLLGGAPVTVTTLDGVTLTTTPTPLVTNHEGYLPTFTADTDQRVILARPRGGDPLPLYAHEAIGDAAEAADTINTGRLSEDALKSTYATHERLTEVATGQEAALTDSAVAGALTGEGNAAKQLLQAKASRDTPETISGDWIFSKGSTTHQDAAKVAVHRSYKQANGHLFDSETMILMRLGPQQGTSQNPPGYNMAEIVLVEDGDNGAQFQGESTAIRLISNRVLFNRRVEVDMGGKSRAVLRTGSEAGQEIAELGMHDMTYPRVAVYGPDNTSHGGTRQSQFVVEQARLVIQSHHSIATQWIKTDSSDLEQRIDVAQFGAGDQTLRAYHDGTQIGSLTWYAGSQTLALDATGGVRAGHLTVHPAGTFRSVGATRTDAAGKSQEVVLTQFSAGQQELRGYYDDVNIGTIRWLHSDSSLRLDSPGGLHLLAPVVSALDITHDAGTGPVLRSPNGTRHRLKVDDGGAITTEVLV